jgi:hypothetical protein
MFSQPHKVWMFAQMRYYLATNVESRRRTQCSLTREAVFPYKSSDASLLGSLSASYWEKAFHVSASNYYLHINPDAAEPALEQRHGHFRSLVQAFERRYATYHLRPDERIARSELWIAFVWTPPAGPPRLPGEWVAVLANQDRRRPAELTNRTVGAIERDGDVKWTLRAIGEHVLAAPVTDVSRAR